MYYAAITGNTIIILTNVYQALALLPAFKLAKQQHPCIIGIVQQYLIFTTNLTHFTCAYLSAVTNSMTSYVNKARVVG